MSHVPVFHGHIDTTGKLRLEEPVACATYCRSLGAGIRVDITVRVHKSQRSMNQNRLWWGYIVAPLAEHFGYDRHEHEMLHYELVRLCFGEHKDERSGLTMPNARSSKLDVKQFTTLIDWALRWAADEHQFAIHLPTESEFDSLEAAS